MDRPVATDPQPPRAAAPPPPVAWVALAVCVASAVMVLLGAWRIGVWTDEPAHVIRYANLQEHGWYLLDDDFDGDQPGSWVSDQYVYAPVTTQLMHGVNRVVGLDPPGGLGTSLTAYAVRHLLVAILGLIGSLAVVVLGRRLLGSWSWGVVAAGTLMAIPMWPGLSMFDIKDVPAATGYTLVTLGLVELVMSSRSGPLWRSWPVPTVAVGLVLALGARPGLWPGLAASLALALVLSSIRSRHRLGAVLLALAVSGALAYGVLLASYPAFFSRPDEWLPGAIGQSAHYSGSQQEPPAGSWAYLPSRVIGVVVPPGLLLVGVVGCLASLSRRGARLSPALAGWLLVAAQALLLPLLAAVRQSHLSDELRQLTFATPAVALLLTWGWRQVVTKLGHDSPRVGAILGVVWSAALVVPVVVQLQLFPYGYTYAAPQAASLGAVDQGDWARLSARELLADIPRGEFMICYPAVSEDGDTMRYLPAIGRPPAEASADCRTDPYSPIGPYRLAEGDQDPYLVEDTFLGLFTRGAEPGRNCEELDRVERRRYLGVAVLSRVARCDLVLNDYPESGVGFGPDGAGADFLLGGWTSHVLETGVKLRDPSGSLGFELPEEWGGRSLRIEFEGEADPGTEISVNNRQLRAVRTPAGWYVDVPSATVASFGERRLVVTVTGSGGEAPVRLTGVRLVPL